MRKICCAIVLLPALAWAQPKTAEEWYKEGENQYNLGNFERAVDAFKQGFALETNDSKKAAYLFNVAQSYRQANDCKNAQFFYKRFLSLKENDTVKPLSARTRKDVEDRISELEACAQQAASISKKPPNNNLPPDGDSADRPAAGERKEPRKDVAASSPEPAGATDDGGAEVHRSAARPPHLIALQFVGGGTKVNAGDSTVPVQATFALTGGYPIPLGDKLRLDAGAAFTFTPVPYTVAARGGAPETSKTGQLVGLLANAGLTYQVAPKIGVRGDLGLGALVFNNISESVFTAGAATSGALTMFHVRAGLSGEYAFTPNVVLSAPSIAFTYSPPKDGLADDIKSITSIDFMIGIGYRM